MAYVCVFKKSLLGKKIGVVSPRSSAARFGDSGSHVYGLQGKNESGMFIEMSDSSCCCKNGALSHCSGASVQVQDWGLQCTLVGVVRQEKLGPPGKGLCCHGNEISVVPEVHGS